MNNNKTESLTGFGWFCLVVVCAMCVLWMATGCAMQPYKPGDAFYGKTAANVLDVRGEPCEKLQMFDGREAWVYRVLENKDGLLQAVNGHCDEKGAGDLRIYFVAGLVVGNEFLEN